MLSSHHQTQHSHIAPVLPPAVSNMVLDRLVEDKETLSNCSLVCKNWNDVALDHVWRRVDGLKALFSLLGPLEVEQSTNFLVSEINST